MLLWDCPGAIITVYTFGYTQAFFLNKQIFNIHSRYCNLKRNLIIDKLYLCNYILIKLLWKRITALNYITQHSIEIGIKHDVILAVINFHKLQKDQFVFKHFIDRWLWKCSNNMRDKYICIFKQKKNQVMLPWIIFGHKVWFGLSI